MPPKNRENLYIALLSPCALLASAWAVYNFPSQRLDWQLGVLTVVTVFFSSFLRIQLPRTKIHVTISDAAIILSFLLYGGEIALILAMLESGFTSILYKQRGGKIRNKTILVNVVNASVAAFATAMIVRSIYGSAPDAMLTGNTATVVTLLTVMGFSQFLFNSALVSLFVASKSETKTVVDVWTEYCLNALVIYLTSAVLAGVTAQAIQQINMMLFVAVAVFFTVVYFTYRRYVDDIKNTSAKAEQAERDRAEQAEVHVKQLQHYVLKLEQSAEDLKRSHEKLRHAAYHDTLTGLPNKYYFVETIKQLLKDCRDDSGRPFAVLFIDLNRFKTINDSVGHTRGDKLIKLVGNRLTELIGNTGIVGRFSGDEFAILITDLRSDRDIVNLACKVTECIAEPFNIFSRELFTSASVGIAFGNRSYGRAENVLRDAEIAMYHAKDSKQKYVIFDEQMHAKAVNLLQLETDLRKAIERQEFEVYYQPIVSLDTLTLAGFEALVRWNHPNKGPIPPSEFIGISESTDLIVPLTLVVLEDSCRTVSRLMDENPSKELFVSVNLSGKHFDHPELVDHISEALEKTGLDPRCLKLEITETAIMANADVSVEMLRSIKNLGVQISIDDFGTGYSSLSYLHKFPLDTLKIDRSFVNSIERGSENAEIVRTVVYLAKALGLDVVAEGIESIHQLSQLQQLGCEYGQGYLFSRPVPKDAIVGFLADDLGWQSLTRTMPYLLDQSVNDIRLVG